MSDNQNEKRHAGSNEDASKTQSEAKGNLRDSVKETEALQEAGVMASQAFSWKRLMAKKWVFPAVYLAAAAIILSIMWAIQNDRDEQLLTEETPGQLDQVDVDEQTNDAFPVTGTPETMQLPVQSDVHVEVVRPFYDANGTNEAKQAATIQYGNVFEPSMGVTLSRPDGESFPVVAALSGKVTRSEELPVVGHVVEITHDNGLKTIYSSLSDVKVQEGDQLMQGEQFAEAGRSEMGKDMIGQHVHFEVMEDENYVNPVDLLPELE